MQTLENQLRLKERIQDYSNISFDYAPNKLLDFQAIDCGQILLSPGKQNKQNNKPTKQLFPCCSS